MALVFDHITKLIHVESPQTLVTIQELVNACRLEEADEFGIGQAQIIRASGKDSLGDGVQTGITAVLLDGWAIAFWPGNYQATITGGNLVGAAGNPIAYVVGGPQVLNNSSAAATIVTTTGGAGSTPAQIADAVWAKVLP